MHPTPVICEIRVRIKNERNTTTRPRIAKVKIFLALSTALGSPPDVRNLNPAKITKNSATTEAKVNSQTTKVANKGKMQLKVATPPEVQLPVPRFALGIIKN